MFALLPVIALAVHLDMPGAHTSGVHHAPTAVERHAYAATWYEYYDQGLKAIDHADWDAAIVALGEAIRLKPKSEFSVKTYGMRFISYFPYYYLGLAHMKRDEVDEALKYFRKEQSTSKKLTTDVENQLTFFINAAETAIEDRDAKATAQQMAAEQARQDSIKLLSSTTATSKAGTDSSAVRPIPTPPPAPATVPARTPSNAKPVKPTQVVFISPVDPDIKESMVRIQGSAFSAPGVTEIILEINGEVKKTWGLATAPDATAGSTQAATLTINRIQSFGLDVPLSSLKIGMNKIVVRVIDAAGVTASATREVKRSK